MSTLECPAQIFQTSAEAIAAEVAGVIPAYRCAPYLAEAVESLLATPIAEIVIAVDGGDRETLRVAEALAEREGGRLRVLARRERLGAAANVNRAVEQIDKPYFLKLDGDDILLPEFMAAAFPKIVGTSSLALVSGYGLQFAGEPVWPARFLPDYTDAIVPLSGAAAYRFIIEWNPNPSSSGTIYRREAFLAVGGYDEKLVWGEDWEIWLRLAAQWSVAYAPVASALYRIHPESSTAAVANQERISDGYDAVYRQALRFCPSRELRPLLRRKFLKVVRAHLGAARRCAVKRRAPIEALRHAGRALSASRTLLALR